MDDSNGDHRELTDSGSRQRDAEREAAQRTEKQKAWGWTSFVVTTLLCIGIADTFNAKSVLGAVEYSCISGGLMAWAFVIFADDLQHRGGWFLVALSVLNMVGAVNSAFRWPTG